MGNVANDIAALYLFGPAMTLDLIREQKAERIACNRAGGITVAPMRHGNLKPMLKILRTKTGVERD